MNCLGPCYSIDHHSHRSIAILLLRGRPGKCAGPDGWGFAIGATVTEGGELYRPRRLRVCHRGDSDRGRGGVQGGGAVVGGRLPHRCHHSGWRPRRRLPLHSGCQLSGMHQPPPSQPVHLACDQITLGLILAICSFMITTNPLQARAFNIDSVWRLALDLKLAV